ncbi:uncharacterized protein LOC113330461 isoform X2 [Papaver somniferum]|uniref:uncharacterized protein LOC113330461 isoform X2 n=1 Tax=Papaver somniferum TaxID=3469 RepID=UPI000E6FEE47|nr:uncharacterized protein LOC113330461 isoform X2 [Papaver somniferum]
MEELLKSFMQRMESTVKELQTQVGSIAIELNQLKAQNGGKLPSQHINLKEVVNAITLRSGTHLVQPEVTDSSKEEAPKEPVLEEKNEDSPQISEVPIFNSKTPGFTYVPPLPFPRRFVNSKKVELEKDILDILNKIHVNIPLIDAIKQVPKDAKVLKNLCTNKQRLKGASVNVMPASMYNSLDLGHLKSLELCRN